MEIFLIQHKSGLFLRNQYVTATVKKSYVSLVENEFPCFNSETAAKYYIEDGDELFYSYDQDLTKEDLTIVSISL